jgi:hypothetical protein
MSLDKFSHQLQPRFHNNFEPVKILSRDMSVPISTNTSLVSRILTVQTRKTTHAMHVKTLTLRPMLATIVAVQKQQFLHILSACLQP